MSFLTKIFHVLNDTQRAANEALQSLLNEQRSREPTYRAESADREKARRSLARVSPIDSLPDHIDQVVRIDGVVRPDGESLRSPFRRRRSVYYEIAIEQRQNEERRKVWNEIVHDKKVVDFFLESSIGNVRVSTADFELDADFPLMEDTAVEGIEEALEVYGASYKQWRFHNQIRLRERFVTLNQRIAVCGRLQWEFDPNPKQAGTGYRETPKRPVITPGPEGFVLALEL